MIRRAVERGEGFLLVLFLYDYKFKLSEFTRIEISSRYNMQLSNDMFQAVLVGFDRFRKKQA